MSRAWARVTPTRFGYSISRGEGGMEYVYPIFRFTKWGANRVANRHVRNREAKAKRESQAWTIGGDR